MAKDYYNSLGVDKNASKEDIKKAYKRLAKQYHPDLNKDPSANEKFKEINEAASVLGDDKKREQFDRFGTTENMQSGFGENDFSAFADFGDIFDQFFGGSKRRTSGRDGSDLLYELGVTLVEVATGISKKIVVPRMETCKKCNGSGARNSSDIHKCSECDGKGRVQRQMRTPFGVFSQSGTCPTCRGEGTHIKNPCEYCDGMGRAKETKTIEVKIPAGVQTGMRLRVSGEGEAGTKGGHHGDLYVEISVEEDSKFVREGDDIFTELFIPFGVAALGGKVEAPTITGAVELTIPEGTQSNTVFRMKGKGLPNIQSYGVGNQNVRVFIEVPTKLSKKQKDLIREFDITAPKKKKGILDSLF